MTLRSERAAKEARLVEALWRIKAKTRPAVAEYRKRVGGWSANEHDHLLIAALDEIAGMVCHHLAGEGAL